MIAVFHNDFISIEPNEFGLPRKGKAFFEVKENALQLLEKIVVCGRHSALSCGPAMPRRLREARAEAQHITEQRLLSA